MKSFFKKIALVLVMAMVVTMMPANLRVASAADDGPQMYPTLKFYLGGDETGKYSDEPRYAVTWNKEGYDVVGQFVSSNPEVAKVNSKGRVTPLTVGTTTITATFKSTTGGEDVVRECVVTVKKNAVDAGISERSADTLKAGLKIGEKFLVTTYRTDADGVTSWKGKDVITSAARFASTDETIFKVTKTGGTVTAVAPGTAQLKVWAVQSESPIKEDGKIVEYLPVTEPRYYTVKVDDPEPDVVTYDRAVLTIGNDKLVADGRPGTLVTFTLYSGPDMVDTETKDVQVRLETTYGTLAFTNVTLENGRATVLYTTPILDKEATARITAIIVSAEDTEEGRALINVQAAPKDIQLVPATNPDSDDETIDRTGASVIGSTVVTTDRITLFFNKPVKAEDFMHRVGGQDVPDTSKFELRIDDAILQTQNSVGSADFTEGDIVNILPNPTSDTSLIFVLKDDKEKKDGLGNTVLDTNGNPVHYVFTDNTKYALNFKDKSKVGQVDSTNVGYVTDAIIPSMLSVAQYNESMTEIIVTFSESMPAFTADHVAIDGIALAGDYAQDTWGIAGHRATVTRLNTTEKTTRHIYRIELGQKLNEKGELEQIYFSPGFHSLTINNVGDYAYWTDSSNFISTATLDFNIKANEVVPTYIVKVQSPEQYLVEFNCDLLDGFTPDLKLEYYNANVNEWQEVTSLKNAVTGLAQAYSVVRLNSRQVLVEVQNDWTKILNGQNYYNYDFRIHVEKNTVKNKANGKTNEQENFKLHDNYGDSEYNLNYQKMKTVDDVSPSIVGEVKEFTSGTEFQVTFDEPIQYAADGFTSFALAGNAGNITPSTAQNGRVPIITAQIVAKDLSMTVDATVTNIDRQNYTLTIKTVGVTLDPGKEYILYVRSVSDDIGNTSLTLSKEFTTGGSAPAPTTFQIAGVWADANLQMSDGIYQLDEVADDTGNNLDAIYVEFTSPFATSGGVKTVLTNTNWSINGYPLPAGSYILGSIIGDSRLTGVTIVLPHGTITDIHATVVTLSTNVEDKNGKSLEGVNRVVTQYQTGVAPWGANNALSTRGDYLGKIGKFAAANPNNNIGVTNVTGTVEKTATNSVVNVTVSGITGITTEQVRIGNDIVNDLAGYKVVVYGIDPSDPEPNPALKKHIWLAEIKYTVPGDGAISDYLRFTVEFERATDSEGHHLTDLYTNYWIEVTALAATEYGDSNVWGGTFTLDEIH